MYHWFDGHLDLAYLALEKRDLRQFLSAAKQGPQPPAITFPSLSEGRVKSVMGTIFPVPKMFAPYGYEKGDAEGVHLQGIEQLGHYHAWENEGWIQVIRSGSGLLKDEESKVSGRELLPLQVILLMEGAEPVRTPEEMRWWFEQGVRVVGLSWAIGTQYAGGNQSGGPLTELGKECIRIMDELGIIHDLSHLSDRSAWMLLEETRGPVIASHSNCRALAGGKSERHLSDELILAIGKRDGIIGLNLFNRFLTHDSNKRRASIEEAISHVEHICELLGNRESVGLGSDMDGGFGANQLPEGIENPSGLSLLLDALAARGWSDNELSGFSSGNWLRFMRRYLP